MPLYTPLSEMCGTRYIPRECGIQFCVEANMFSYEKIGFSNLTSAPAVERVVEFSPSGIDAAAIVRVFSDEKTGEVKRRFV